MSSGDAREPRPLPASAPSQTLTNGNGQDVKVNGTEHRRRRQGDESTGGRDPSFVASGERTITIKAGRQRECHLHISSVKQAATHEARGDRCTEKILAGKGFRDR